MEARFLCAGVGSAENSDRNGFKHLLRVVNDGGESSIIIKEYLQRICNPIKKKRHESSYMPRSSMCIAIETHRNTFSFQLALDIIL